MQRLPVIGDRFYKEIPPEDNVSLRSNFVALELDSAFGLRYDRSGQLGSLPLMATFLESSGMLISPTQEERTDSRLLQSFPLFLTIS